MPIRRPLLTEGLPANPVLDPTMLALVGAYYQIAGGVVVPAAHAASHAAGGTDPVTLTQAQITGLVSDLALRVLKSGDTMSGNLTLGSGGNLTLTGGATAAQGNIQMSAPASAVYDSNVLYLGNNNQTCGMIASATNAFLAANGPYFGLRGNNYTATASQRGNLFLAAGNPAAPGSAEGSVAILTGNDLTRLLVTNAGKVLLSGTSAAASFVDASILQVNGTVTQAAGGDFYAVRVNPTLTKASSGTHPYALGVFVQAPTISGGAGAVTNAASLAIEAQPTGASNNYALLILAGKARFDGNVQIGVAGAGTAKLHIAAGSASASTAPLKFTSGPLLGAAEAGAVEFLTDKAYLTITTGTARKELALADSALTAGQQPTTTTNGRLTDSRKYSIYATSTSTGVPGSTTTLPLFTLASGELRFLRITVKAKTASNAHLFGRTLDAMWRAPGGVLSAVGSTSLGTAMTAGNLAAAGLAMSSSGTTVQVTCTDTTGCGSTVTWEAFGEYY